MSPTIPVSDETKSMLSVFKGEDENWDEFLSRLVRRERDVEDLGGFAEADIVDRMETTHDALNESYEDQIEADDELPR